MASRHPFDPEHGYRVAETAARLVAQGVLEAADLRDKIVAHAEAEGFPSMGDQDGYAMRVLWHINDVAEGWRRERDRTEWRIREAVRPLIAAWAEPLEILRAGHAANEAAGEPFLRLEVREIVGQELDVVVRRYAKERRRRVR